MGGAYGTQGVETKYLYFCLGNLKEEARLTFYSLAFFYVPPGLIFKKSTLCSLCDECFVRIAVQTAIFALHINN
jgi:hypothetical protein